MTVASAFRAGGAIPWLVVAGVLVAALSLRGPIVAPTPVLVDIQVDLGIGPAPAGLLTTVPVLMFALLTPIAALVIRRGGAETALMLSLTGVFVGTVVRAIPGFGWMLLGSLLIGAAITIGNVVIPVVIRRDVPPVRVGTVTAAYVATLNAGSLITALGTAPLAALIGWSLALLAWVSITVFGIILWGVHIRRRQGLETEPDRSDGETAAGETRHDPEAPGGDAVRADAAPPATNPLAHGTRDGVSITGPTPVTRSRSDERTMLRRPVTWLLMLAFAGQTTGYYALTTWLPAILGDELGVDRTGAGALASIFHGAGIAGAFVVPLLTRYFPTIVPALAICGCWLALTVGMLAAPGLFVVWACFGAIAHAGGFVVIFTGLVDVARSDREAAGMSAFVQGGGYAVGALGAPIMGGLREAFDGWTAPLVFVLIVSVAYCVLLLAALTSARRAR